MKSIASKYLKGNEIYQHGNVSIFEIDGYKN